MEERKKVNKHLLLARYLSQLTKMGIMQPQQASNLLTRFREQKDMGEIMDEIMMLPVSEDKRNFYDSVVNTMFQDKVLVP